jgi:hypothetical protein
MLPKLKVPALALRLPGVAPIPSSGSAIGSVCPVLIVNAPDCFPLLFGAKAILKDTLWPGERVMGSVMPCTLKLLEEELICRIVIVLGNGANPPVLAAAGITFVTVWVNVLVLPTETLPKLTFGCAKDRAVEDGGVLRPRQPVMTTAVNRVIAAASFHLRPDVRTCDLVAPSCSARFTDDIPACI